MTPSGHTTSQPIGRRVGRGLTQPGGLGFSLAATAILVAAVATYLGQLASAGFFLLASLIHRRSTPNTPLPLSLREMTPGKSVILDLVLSASVSTSLKLGALASSSPKALDLFWLPAVLALLVASTHHKGKRREPPAPTTQAARLLLAVGFCLTPLASRFYSISAGAWTLVCFTTWCAVHLLNVARRALVFFDASGVVAQTRLVLSGKGSALRNGIAAAVATGLDFCIFSALVALGALSPPGATFVGAATGGLVNFLLNRNWTFSARGSTRTMARRYVTVSATSALLNSTVVFVLMLLPGPDATLAWLIARGLVFLGWNFPLQRDYVFSHRPSEVTR